MINQKDSYLEGLKKERAEIQSKKDSLLTDNINLEMEEKIDPFEWLADIVKVRSGILRFVLYLLLAVFSDVIPPLFLSEIIFYKMEE
jgi:hypothetical protein